MRATLMNYTAIALVMGLATAANAAPVKNVVTDAQERLNTLGYNAGKIDGVIGKETQEAIMEFQRNNALPVTGTLTPETYSMMWDNYGYNRGFYRDGIRYSNYYGYNDANRIYGYNDAYRPYDTRWNYAYGNRASYYQQVGTLPIADSVGYRNYNYNLQGLPIRFGHLSIHRDTWSGANNYTVMLNGQSVLNANNQPEALRVSKVFNLSDEDAVIISAYDGTSGCNFKNYLLTVKSNGTYTPAREIGNCTGTYEARVDGNMLYISFANYNGSAYGKDIWRYSNNSLGRVYDAVAGL